MHQPHNNTDANRIFIHYPKNNWPANAQVKADSLGLAENLLDAHLLAEYPELGREDCHFEADGYYFFHLVGEIAK